MDTPWSPTDWEPTADPESMVYKRPSSLEVHSFQKSLQDLTTSLTASPYHPVIWTQRAVVLLSLGYPELATGDAYRALLLVRASREPQSFIGSRVNHHLDFTTSDKKVRSASLRGVAEQDALLTLVSSLLIANCLQESLDYAVRAVSLYPENTKLQSSLLKVQRAYDHDQLESETDENLVGMNALEEKEYRRSGHVLSHSYPWMDAKLFSRGVDVMRRVQQELLSASWGQCQLERSLVREGMALGDRSERVSDVLGVTATKDLAQNENLLVDHTAVSAVDDPTNRCPNCRAILTATFARHWCCSTQYCSRYCADRAFATYHQAVCGKDLSRFEQAYRKKLVTAAKAADELLLLRVLTSAVQHFWEHPLNTPFAITLTAIYDGKKRQPFDCESNIIGTFDLLSCLGINIFTNHKFDTWVLQTLRARICNNSREYTIDGHVHVAVNPLYSFFNHSCDPNVKWEDDKTTHSSTVRMSTLRRVNRGEELFINYQQELVDEPLSVRREVLREWLGSDCQCSRCMAEEADEVRRRQSKLRI